MAKRIIPPVVGDDEKYCRRCETTKPKKEFGNNIASKDKLQGWCKLCQNAASEVSHERKRIRDKEAEELSKHIASLPKEERERGEKLIAKAIMEKNNKKESKRVGWDTSDVVVSERVIKQIEPLHKYLCNLVVRKDGTIMMKKSIGDIVDFFDLDVRRGLDLIYSFIKREHGVYRLSRGVGSVKEMALLYDDSLRVKKQSEEEETAFLAERFFAVEEEVRTLKKIIKGLADQFN
jgi:hypothetical protein